VPELHKALMANVTVMMPLDRDWLFNDATSTVEVRK
jgi:hypothetical protein